MARAPDNLVDEASRRGTPSAGAARRRQGRLGTRVDAPHRRSILRTRQRASGSRLVERSGLGRVSFDLAVEDGALMYRQSSIHFAGLPVPSSLSPRVRAVVSATAEGWRVVVTVTWRGRIVCRYAGTIRAS